MNNMLEEVVELSSCVRLRIQLHLQQSAQGATASWPGTGSSPQTRVQSNSCNHMELSVYQSRQGSFREYRVTQQVYFNTYNATTSKAATATAASVPVPMHAIGSIQRTTTSAAAAERTNSIGCDKNKDSCSYHGPIWCASSVRFLGQSHQRKSMWSAWRLGLRLVRYKGAT